MAIQSKPLVVVCPICKNILASRNKSFLCCGERHTTKDHLHKNIKTNDSEELKVIPVPAEPVIETKPEETPEPTEAPLPPLFEENDLEDEENFCGGCEGLLPNPIPTFCNHCGAQLKEINNDES